MRITSELLIDVLNNNIVEYNDRFNSNLDFDKRIPVIEDDMEEETFGEISEKNISKFLKLNIRINTAQLTELEIEEFNEELETVLCHMKLEAFIFNVINKDGPVPYDTTFLDGLNENIQNVQLRGIDLSEEGPELLSRFKDLRYLSLERCNISDPKIISELEGNIFGGLLRFHFDGVGLERGWV